MKYQLWRHAVGESSGILPFVYQAVFIMNFTRSTWLIMMCWTMTYLLVQFYPIWCMKVCDSFRPIYMDSMKNMETIEDATNLILIWIQCELDIETCIHGHVNYLVAVYSACRTQYRRMCILLRQTNYFLPNRDTMHVVVYFADRSMNARSELSWQLCTLCII